MLVHGSYGYKIQIAALYGGTEKTVSSSVEKKYYKHYSNSLGTRNKYLEGGTLIKSITSSKTGWAGGSESIDWSFNTENNNLNVYICYKCGQPGDCDQGYSDGDNHSAWIIVGKINTSSLTKYNPETPATNASNGKIYSTNNSSGGTSGRAISDKPDLQIWWDWTGATAGTPDSKYGIEQYNIDISTTNDSSTATSIAMTQNYSKNTPKSLFDLCRSYGVKIGGTLYCWVNTKIKNGTWLRKSLFRLNYNKKRWFHKI